jgi:hypothetical protein
MYQLFYDGGEPPNLPNFLKRKSPDDIAWGSSGKNGVYFQRLVKCLGRASDADRKLLFVLAQRVATASSRRTAKAAQ